MNRIKADYKYSVVGPDHNRLWLIGSRVFLNSFVRVCKCNILTMWGLSWKWLKIRFKTTLGFKLCARTPAAWPKWWRITVWWNIYNEYSIGIVEYFDLSFDVNCASESTVDIEVERFKMSENLLWWLNIDACYFMSNMHWQILKFHIAKEVEYDYWHHQRQHVVIYINMCYYNLYLYCCHIVSIIFSCTNW